MQRGIDYIGIGVGAVIQNGEGKFFLSKRGKEARNERYRWEFPGGSVEFGEKLADALIREVHEEFNITISIQKLLDVVDHIIPDEGQHWVSPTFLCSFTKGVPSIQEPHKCEEIGWFSLDEIRTLPLSSASEKSLQSLLVYLSSQGDQS
ncbi:MAG: NUDIX domain-containing protein [Nitrospiraceae bacterium]|nr:NUDIX domain-containing protein [Nitrospiraceae bacterium]